MCGSGVGGCAAARSDVMATRADVWSDWPRASARASRASEAAHAWRLMFVCAAGVAAPDVWCDGRVADGDVHHGGT